MNDFSADDFEQQKVYSKSVKFSREHYENFPVASVFLPKNIRKHVAVVYRFARNADDIADEGNMNEEQRTDILQIYKQQLTDALQGNYANDFWRALHNTIKTYKLTEEYFYDLLSAFEQDITKKRYETFSELLDYCSRSANPVGRIILEFFNIREHEALKFSDAICTALQLTNFYQDVSVDLKKGRIYLPAEDLERHNVGEEEFSREGTSIEFKNLMKSQVERNFELYREGVNILPLLPTRLRFQIRLTILGGQEILNKIRSADFNVLNVRPKLSKIDYIKLFLKAALR